MGALGIEREQQGAQQSVEHGISDSLAPRVAQMASWPSAQ
jgi:hypothetical protein